MAVRVRPSFSSSRFPGLLISNLVFSNTKLGRGADATVFEAEWNGTPAKRLHEILLEDESPGGTEKLLSNFEAECITWSKLRHPGVVQFLGVHLEPGSCLPVLIMEKMDTSLRKYLEDHSKEVFPLGLKAFVLRQITQALAYLHDQNPPLVHHDLSPNNVLLNLVSYVTKLTDFGMSRAINPSAISRKSSIKGTPAFMPPEALQTPPRYNEKLDVFSFGNIILTTVTHEWPEPCLPTQYKGARLIALDEFQRRERYVEMFTAQEKQLFLPTVRRCLDNRPDKRPSSMTLVQELRRIESTLTRGDHVAAPIEQLRQHLSAKVEECRERDKALREKDSIIQQQQDVIQTQQVEIERLRNSVAVDQKVKPPPRDWRELGGCQKVIQHRSEGSRYFAVAVNSEGLLAIADGLNHCVHLLTNKGTLLRSIGEGLLGGLLLGVAFDLKGNVWVADWHNNNVVKLSPSGQLLHTMHNAGDEGVHFSNPRTVCVSSEGLIYVSDHNNHRVTVHDEEGKFLLAFGAKGSGPGCFDGPGDIAFGSDGLVYVTDGGNNKVCVWSKEGTFKTDFKTTCPPTCIAATSDNHLLITSSTTYTVMVYTLEGELIHLFGAHGSHPGRFNTCWGICIDKGGLVYVADIWNTRVQVFRTFHFN